MTSQICAAGARRLAALKVFFGLIAASLIGCGGSNSITPTPNPPSFPTSITGDWQFTAAINGGRNIPLAAYLTSAAGAVSGTAVADAAFPGDGTPECCGGPFASFSSSLTGTVDAKNNLTLVSTVPNGGPVFTMTGIVNAGTLANGSFTLTGPCPAQGTITGTEYPTLNGTYTGTLTSTSTGQSFVVSTTFDQSAALNSRGFFNVNGTANFAGYPCMTSAVVATPLEMNSGFLGNNFEVTMNAAPSGDLIVSGTLSPDGKTLAVTYFFVLMGSSCNNDKGTGSLKL